MQVWATRSAAHTTAAALPWRVRGLCCSSVVVEGCDSSVAETKSRRGTVYIHWPYCSQLCSYCNFNKYVRKHVDHEKMASCLLKEVNSLLKMSAVSTVTSIYFGGGTPSLAKPSMVEATVSAIANSARLVDNAEVTLEANPTSTEVKTLRDFKSAGVTRLSLGVQSLNDPDLKFLNRDHTAKEARRALQEAHSIFPGKTSMDMIFGRPNQTHDTWVAELKEVLTLCGNHMSLYQLTVEEGTPLSKALRKSEVMLPSEDAIADMYEAAILMLNNAGLVQYEISNFARDGFWSQHNMSYWTGVDYIGIGPGAHSRFAVKENSQYLHAINTLEPNAWMHKVCALGHGMQKAKYLSTIERLEEVIATSMRTSQGLTDEIWRQFTGAYLAGAFSPYRSESLRGLFVSGLLILDNRGIRATPSGLMVLDSILPDLIAAVEVPSHRCRNEF